MERLTHKISYTPRKLNAPELLPLVLAGEQFKDGMQETDKENTDRKVAA